MGAPFAGEESVGQVAASAILAHIDEAFDASRLRRVQDIDRTLEIDRFVGLPALFHSDCGQVNNRADILHKRRQAAGNGNIAFDDIDALGDFAQAQLSFGSPARHRPRRDAQRDQLLDDLIAEVSGRACNQYCHRYALRRWTVS